MERLQELLAEAERLAKEIEALLAESQSEVGAEGEEATPLEAEAQASRQRKLNKLVTRSKKVAEEIESAKAAMESAKSLRAVADRCKPAPEVVRDDAARIEPVSYRGRLKAFSNDEQGRRDAYSFGKWLQGYVHGDADAKRWCHDHGVESRALGESVNSAGGVFVPEIASGQVVRLVEEFSVWPAAMQLVQMPSDTVTAVKRLTGVTANWTGESSEILTSDPSATDIRLVAKKLTVGTRVSNELLADAAAVGDWVIAEFATAIGEKLDQAAVNGDGTNAYGGVYGIANKILTAAGSFHKPASARDAFDEFTVNDFLSVVALLPTYVTSPRWYISSAGFANSMQRLDLGALGRPSFENGTGFSFLGYPVTITNVLPRSGNLDEKVSVLFGDASLAGMYGIRSAFATKISTERYVELDQTLYIGVARADMVWHSVGSATEAGPMVALVGNT
jgi:HK97 family phage major capsid protein